VRRAVLLIAGNLLVLTLLLGAFAAAIECWYRFGFDGSDGLAVTRVAERWFSRHWRTNGVGVRDDVEYGDAAGLRLVQPPGVRRLTFFGDSVTAAQGVPDVSRRFANRLRADLGARSELHVFAFNGADTGAQLDVLRDLLAKGYRLDLVVWVYFPNDALDLVPQWRDALAETLALQGREPALVRRSFALDFWWWRWQVSRGSAYQRHREWIRDAHAGTFWQAQQRRLREIERLCASNQATLLVVTLPLFAVAPGDETLDGTYRTLDAFWRERGVPHLDLTARFSDSAGSWVVSRFDEHPNEAAHAVIAAELTKFLAAQGVP